MSSTLVAPTRSIFNHTPLYLHEAAHMTRFFSMQHWKSGRNLRTRLGSWPTFYYHDHLIDNGWVSLRFQYAVSLSLHMLLCFQMKTLMSTPSQISHSESVTLMRHTKWSILFAFFKSSHKLRLSPLALCLPLFLCSPFKYNKVLCMDKVLTLLLRKVVPHNNGSLVGTFKVISKCQEAFACCLDQLLTTTRMMSGWRAGCYSNHALWYSLSGFMTICHVVKLMLALYQGSTIYVWETLRA